MKISPLLHALRTIKQCIKYVFVGGIIAKSMRKHITNLSEISQTFIINVIKLCIRQFYRAENIPSHSHSRNGFRCTAYCYVVSYISQQYDIWVRHLVATPPHPHLTLSLSLSQRFPDSLLIHLIHLIQPRSTFFVRLYAGPFQTVPALSYIIHKLIKTFQPLMSFEILCRDPGRVPFQT